MRVRLSTTRRQTFGNFSDFNFRLLPTEQNFAPIWALEIALKHCLVSQVFEIPLRYLHMHKIICLAYFIKMSDPRPVSCPGCLFTSGTKRCREEEIVLPTPPPHPSPTINLVKRLELEDCLLLLAAAILGYVLSNPGEKTRHASFVQPPFNLASSLH